jgi:hypothetical protein
MVLGKPIRIAELRAAMEKVIQKAINRESSRFSPPVPQAAG